MWTVKECNFLEGGKANRVEKRIFFFFFALEFSKISLFYSRHYDFKHEKKEAVLQNKGSGSLDSDHFHIFMLPRKYFAS